MAEILFVLTGADHWTLADGSEHPTGFWAEEFVVPYQVLTGAGHQITVATPGGVVPQADPASLTADFGGQDFGVVLEGIAALRSPIKIEEADPTAYDAVFYPGGHGPMEDLSVNADSGRLLTAALDSGKPLAVVCHGPAALLAAERADGTPTFAGYRLAAFTNDEETQAGFADKAAWLLEDRLVALGANVDKGEPWAPHVVVDRNLYTGQNPSSSGPLADEILKALG